MSWLNKFFALKAKVVNLEQNQVAIVKQEIADAKPLFCHVTDAFNGRCTFFAVVFTFFGILLAFMGKLTSQYVLLVGSIQALLVAHSAKEDYHERNSGGDSNASV